MMKRKMWNGRAEPEGVVGIGKKGAMPVPTPVVNNVVRFFSEITPTFVAELGVLLHGGRVLNRKILLKCQLA